MPNLHYRLWFQMDSEARSLVTESEWCKWREEALRWFLTHGVEANLAEDLAQEVLRRLFRCQQPPCQPIEAVGGAGCRCDTSRRPVNGPVTLYLEGC